MCVYDYEQRAINTLPRNALDYYKSGSDSQITLQLNKTAFQRYLYYNDHKVN